MQFEWDPDFHHPSGIEALPGLYATKGSIIRFSRSNGICWYMDSSFCEGFHQMKRDVGADTVLLIGRLIIFIVWGIGIAWACWYLLSFSRKTFKLIGLEREKASSQLRKSVRDMLHALEDENRRCQGSYDLLHLEAPQMRELLEAVSKKRNPDGENEVGWSWRMP